MNKKKVILLAGGLLVTMLLAIMVQAMLSPQKEKTASIERPTEILVASQYLEIGHELNETSMRWTEWPDHALFSGAIVREGEQEPLEALNGLMLRPIQEGEPMMESALVKENKGNFLAASLKTGMRAMAIRVSAESSVGGFVLPGDHVDVLMTYQVRVPSHGGAKDAAAGLVSRNASQTVLENVRVLAVDQESKLKDNAKVARTVTLEVNKGGSETLALASSMGELSLVLRKLGDDSMAVEEDKRSMTTDVLVSDVLRHITGGQAASSGKKVRVYNGLNLEEQVVRARIAPPLIK